MVAVMVGAGAFAWHTWSNPIGEKELISFLEERTGNKINFTSIDRGIVKESDGHLRVTFAATGNTREPLFARIDSAEFLHRELHLDAAPAHGEPSGASPERSNEGPPPPDPGQAILLQLRSAAGASVTYLGTLEATRGHDGWSLAAVEGGYGGDGASPGEKRASFGSPSFVVSEPGDLAALRVLVAARRDYDARLASAEKSVGPQASASQFQAFLAPGTVFRGFALDRDGRKSPALFLEITEKSQDRSQVAALLRNDGGWHDARLFQGEWRLGPDGGSLSLTLSSPPSEAVRNSGPFVEEAQTRALELRMAPDGELSGADRNYRYSFTPLTSDQAASQKAVLLADFEAAIAATAPGKIYRGTATPHQTRMAESILLRFVRRDQSGATIEAHIESTTRKWERTASGSILGNAHRNGGAPVRLMLSASDAVPAAGATSIMGSTDDLELHLGLDGHDLVGEDAQFDYRFTPASNGDLRQFEGARVARTERFVTAFRPGIDFDGNIRDDLGYNVRARLHVAELEADGREVTVNIETRNDPPFSREFAGSFDPADGVLSLETTPRMWLDPSGDVGIPFYTAARGFSLQLSLAGNTITGRVTNDDHLTLEFPADSVLSDLPPMPSCPKAAGAYVLKEGAWVPLPRNGGHAVPYKAPAKSGPVATELGEVFNTAAGTLLHVDVSGLMHPGDGGKPAPRQGKSADLIFDGKDPIPRVDGSRIIVLWVGSSPAASPEALRAEGTSISRPLIEMAPTTEGKEGIRSAELVRLSPDTDTFGELRVAAYVHDLEPGVMLFTATTAVEAGDYAVRTDKDYELTVR